MDAYKNPALICCRGAQTITAFINPRTLLGCYYRCFCSYGVQNSYTQPKMKPDSSDPAKGLSRCQSENTYEIQIDAPDDFNRPYNIRQTPDALNQPKKGRMAKHYVDTIGVTTSTEVQLRRNEPDTKVHPISLDLANHIECRGDKPPWPLPGGYTSEDFEDLASLCAVQWSGGGM